MNDRLRLLFVCTANQCRSPMAGALLRRRLAERGCHAAIATAGFMAAGQPVPPEVLAAMAAVDIDLSAHLSRMIEPPLLEGADVIVTMTRQQLVDAVSLVPAVWERAFTLRELVGRGEAVGPRQAQNGDRQDVAAWIRVVGAGRTRSGILGLAMEDDIADPMGGRQRGFERTRDELDDLAGRLAELLCPKLTL